MERDALQPAWVDTGLVFVQPDGRGYHPDRLRELFQAVARRAGVPVIRLHDARHSCATLALDAGLHPKVVQQLLGHSSWGVTMDLYSTGSSACNATPALGSRSSSPGQARPTDVLASCCAS